MVKEIEVVDWPEKWSEKKTTELAEKGELEEIAEEENKDIRYVRETVRHNKGSKIEDGGFFGSDKYEWVDSVDNVYFVEREDEFLYIHETVAKKKFPKKNTCAICGKNIPYEKGSYTAVRAFGHGDFGEILYVCTDCLEPIMKKIEEEGNSRKDWEKVARNVVSEIKNKCGSESK